MAKKSIQVFANTTTNTTSSSISTLISGAPYTGDLCFTVNVSGSTVVAATVTIYGTCIPGDTSNGGIITTITLGNGSATSDYLTKGGLNMYPYIYATITGISGTGAAVNLYVGV